jgi:hypothetical protein
MQTIGLVRVDLKGWSQQEFITETNFMRVLLILLVSMSESWQLASLPREMSYVKARMEWNKEEKSVEDYSPLVSIPEHYRVLSLHHSLIIINKKITN